LKIGASGFLSHPNPNLSEDFNSIFSVLRVVLASFPNTVIDICFVSLENEYPTSLGLNIELVETASGVKHLEIGFLNKTRSFFSH